MRRRTPAGERKRKVLRENRRDREAIPEGLRVYRWFSSMCVIGRNDQFRVVAAQDG